MKGEKEEEEKKEKFPFSVSLLFTVAIKSGRRKEKKGGGGDRRKEEEEEEERQEEKKKRKEADLEEKPLLPKITQRNENERDRGERK